MLAFLLVNKSKNKAAYILICTQIIVVCFQYSIIKLNSTNNLCRLRIIFYLMAMLFRENIQNSDEIQTEYFFDFSNFFIDLRMKLLFIFWLTNCFILGLQLTRCSLAVKFPCPLLNAINICYGCQQNIYFKRGFLPMRIYRHESMRLSSS